MHVRMLNTVQSTAVSEDTMP